MKVLLHLAKTPISSLLVSWVILEVFLPGQDLQSYLHFYTTARSEAQIAKRPLRREVYHEQGLLFIGGL